MGVYYWVVNHDRREFLHGPRIFDHGLKYGEWNYGSRPTLTDALMYLLDAPGMMDNWRGWWHGQRVALVSDHGCIGGFTEMLEEDSEGMHPDREGGQWRNITKAVVEQMKRGNEECWGDIDGEGSEPPDYEQWYTTGSDGQEFWHRKT